MFLAFFLLAGFIWQKHLAALRVQQVNTVAPQDSLVHLVFVRPDPIVQVETQQAQVGSKNTEVFV